MGPQPPPTQQLPPPEQPSRPRLPLNSSNAGWLAGWLPPLNDVDRENVATPNLRSRPLPWSTTRASRSDMNKTRDPDRVAEFPTMHFCHDSRIRCRPLSRAPLSSRIQITNSFSTNRNFPLVGSYPTRPELLWRIYLPRRWANPAPSGSDNDDDDDDMLERPSRVGARQRNELVLSSSFSCPSERPRLGLLAVSPSLSID